MQLWKFTKNEAQLRGNPDRGYEILIPDSGFASTSHPKLKFNFTLDLVFRVNASRYGAIMGNEQMEFLDIPVKTATRPNVNFNMTDVNYYNYRTKVSTKVDYGTCTVVMYDDGNGVVHDIYRYYMEMLSPIARTGPNRGLVDNPTEVPFGQMSSIGPLPLNAAHGFVQTLSVYHFYVRNGTVQRVEYRYINPKIQTFDLDELNMSESDVNTISMTFAYDGVTVLESEV